MRAPFTVPAKWLIPARAGKTVVTALSFRAATAHPRACGENWEATDMGSRAPGSSPRVRGKLVGHRPRRARPGLIPARAGKTSFVNRVVVNRGAHPRACGENDPYTLPGVPGAGSSPRVRGKLSDGGACSATLGSSPRVRGKHPGRVRLDAAAGLIPARAGKTTTPAPKPAPSAVHPRACGENSANISTVQATYGSSPRVRGKPEVPHGEGEALGLIPARAGKTFAGRGRRP